MTGKKKPTALKILKGTARKSRLLPNEIQPELVQDLPVAPDYLSDEAKTEWDFLMPQLKEFGLLAKTDLSLFAAYCNEMGEYIRTVKELKRTGNTLVTSNGNEIQHPLVGIKNKCFSNLHKMATEFGFTPRSRTGIAGASNKVEDPFEQLLKGLNG